MFSLQPHRVRLCACVCARLFSRSVFWKRKKKNPGIPNLGFQAVFFTPPLVCTRSGQMAHLIRVVVPAGAAIAVNYNDYEYNQRDWHIILHLLTKYQGKQKLFDVLEWASICAEFSLHSFGGGGAKSSKQGLNHPMCWAEVAINGTFEGINLIWNLIFSGFSRFYLVS